MFAKNLFSFKKKLILALFCVLNFSLFQGNLFASELSGAALSDALSDKFKRAGYNPQKQSLSSAWFVNFPYNIEINFAPSNESDWTMLLAVAQEDAANNAAFIDGLLSGFRNAYLPCALKVIFTACDQTKISGNERMAGTEIFCKSVEGAQNAFALVLSFGKKRKSFVTSGSCGKLSPYYLTRLLCQCLDNNSCQYEIEGGIFLSLYKLNAFKRNSRLASFLKRDIPAAMLTIVSEDGKAESNSIKDFFSQVEPEKCAEWSGHYIPFKFFARRYWLEEKAIIYSVLAFIAITAFILADFAFLFRKRSRRLAELKTKALVSNYLIFLTAAILTLSFFLGQQVAQGFRGLGVRSPPVLFVIKLLPAFFIVSILYPLELSRHKRISTYLYEYILSISAILNIFIFTFIDVSFFYLFALEYVILMASRAFKSSALLFIFIILYILPFLPVIYSLMTFSDGQNVYNLVFCGLSGNVYLSFILVPFNLLWLRILARRNIKAQGKRNLIYRYASASVSAIVFLTFFSFVTIHIMNVTFFRNVEPPKPRIKIVDAAQKTNSTVTVFDTDYYGGKIRRVEITCSKEPERCEVYVKGSDSNPVYFSVFESERFGNITQFFLPDRPPKNFTVQYTPSPSDSEIVVMNYFIQGEREICERENFAFVCRNGRISEWRKER